MLAPGETGIVLVIAPDTQQATIVLDYCEAALRQSPVLSQLVVDRVERELRLSNGVTIAVGLQISDACAGQLTWP